MKRNKIQKLQKVLKFLSLAEAVEKYSADKSTKVGAVALDKRLNVLCVGYNGFPRKVLDTPERHERPLKYKVTAHAEENLVAQAAFIGAKLRGATLLLTTLFPCTTCCRLIIQSGIVRVISSKSKSLEKWDEEEKISLEMFREAGIEVIYFDKETGELKEVK